MKKLYLVEYGEAKEIGLQDYLDCDMNGVDIDYCFAVAENGDDALYYGAMNDCGLSQADNCEYMGHTITAHTQEEL